MCPQLLVLSEEHQGTLAAILQIEARFVRLSVRLLTMGQDVNRCDGQKELVMLLLLSVYACLIALPCTVPLLLRQTCADAPCTCQLR